MEITRFSTKTRKTFLGLFAVLIMLMVPLSLHAKKVTFLQSSIVPAAKGYVKISTDRNNNNIIKIRIKYLVEIERLDPAMKTYVVWMETDRQTTINIGRITSTSKLNISFNAVSSFQPVKIFITAEETESTRIPGSMIVLSTDNFWE